MSRRRVRDVGVWNAKTDEHEGTVNMPVGIELAAFSKKLLSRWPHPRCTEFYIYTVLACSNHATVDIKMATCAIAEIIQVV